MPPSRDYISTRILNAYFPVTRNLGDYLREVLQLDPTFSFCSNEESPTLMHLISTTLVCFRQSSPSRQTFRVLPPLMTMRELIDRAQERIIKSSRGVDIITSGYKLRSSSSQRGKANRVGVMNFFVNTVVTALQGPDWEALLQRTCADVMIHLLTDTYIFVALPNNCFCQMTGVPIVSLAPLHRDLLTPDPSSSVKSKAKAAPGQTGIKRKLEEIFHARPMKRRRLDRSGSSVSSNSSKKAPIVELSPVNVSLSRMKLYYSRPTRVPHSQRIVVGLPPKHILNQIEPAYHRKPKASPETWVDPDPRKLDEQARLLSKYIFPGQYGLSNPFASIRSPFDAKVPDFGDRRREIELKGPCKTPKRLKGTLEVLRRMIHRHGKCGYKPLRDKFCPSKVKTPDHKDLDSSIILEMMSEDASHLFTQHASVDTSTDTVGNLIPAEGLTQAQNHAQLKPKFAEFACSYAEVFQYVSAITQAVIPKALWGSDGNYKLIMKHVKAFIKCRRFETLTLHHILQGFSTAACEWLMPAGSKQPRVSVSDALKRRELLEEFLFWYFDGFVIPLLKTTFYITESSAFRKKTLYFRHDDWDTICAPLVEKLTSTTFQEIPQSESEELLRQRKLGFSFVRLLPKDSGVRPIVNLRRKLPGSSGNATGSDKSINQILQTAFHILTYEKTQQPLRLGASLFNPEEIHQKLLRYKHRLPKLTNGKLPPKLYFVKLDVQACFDSIEQSKLLSIIRSLITEERYMIQRYGEVSSVAGRLNRRFVKRALPEDEHPHFIRYATELAGRLHGIIFADQVVYPHAKHEDILQLLEEHITENVVKIDNSYYRQMVGIPQGSILSTLLCSFFYGDMESKFPGAIIDDPQSLLLRMVDDYLFITTDLSKAKMFLKSMMEGHPEYGCFVAKDKTMTNFDSSENVLNVVEPSQRTFPWCGLMFNMSTLSVSIDYTRLYGTNLRNTLTIDRGRNPGRSFMAKMTRLAQSRRQSILYDSELTSDHDALLNAYQHFAILAMKMHGYLHEWNLMTARSHALIHNTIKRVINSTAKSLVSSRTGKGLGPPSQFSNCIVSWLGVHAFHAIFSTKPLRCRRAVIEMLNGDMSSPKYQAYRKRFRKLTSEAMKMLSQIQY